MLCVCVVFGLLCALCVRVVCVLCVLCLVCVCVLCLVYCVCCVCVLCCVWCGVCVCVCVVLGVLCVVTMPSCPCRVIFPGALPPHPTPPWGFCETRRGGEVRLSRVRTRVQGLLCDRLEPRHLVGGWWGLDETSLWP